MIENDVEVIERCETPRGEIQLQRRGTEYEIISNGTFLMATYNGRSERLLVKAALEACETDSCSVFIGGLGVGFSLAEAVCHPRTQQVTVIEIEEKVIQWNRSHLARFSGNALENNKTKIIHADLIQWMLQAQETFDVICLDIDNGPDWTVFQENQSLYNDEGLKNLLRMLKPNGVVSIWSASSSPEFLERLKVHFHRVEVVEIEHDQSAEPDVIYIAKVL